VPLEDIAAVLGQADTRMAQRYAHIKPGRLLAVMQSLVSADPRTDTATDTEAREAADAP